MKPLGRKPLADQLNKKAMLRLFIEQRIIDANGGEQSCKDKCTDFLKGNHTVGNPPPIKIERPKDIPTVNTKIEIIEGVKVSENEVDKLKEIFGEGYLWAIETLSNYKLSSGKNYKSDYHALIGWVKTKYDEQITKSKTTGINGLTPADIRMANWLRQGSNG